MHLQILHHLALYCVKLQVALQTWEKQTYQVMLA